MRKFSECATYDFNIYSINGFSAFLFKEIHLKTHSVNFKLYTQNYFVLNYEWKNFDAQSKISQVKKKFLKYTVNGKISLKKKVFLIQRNFYPSVKITFLKYNHFD